MNGNSGLDLDAIFDAWSQAALGELDRSPRTVAAYRSAWREYCRFVPGRKIEPDIAERARLRQEKAGREQEPLGTDDPKGRTRDEVASVVGLGDLTTAAVAYRNDLRQRRLAAGTIHTRLAAIRSVFKWADGERLITEDPLRRFRLPRNGRNPRSAIDQDAYEELLTRLPSLAPVPRLIIGIAAYAGLRSSEVRHLNVEDIDVESHQLTVRQGKGNRDRVVFMHPDLVRLITTTWAETKADGESAKARIEELCRRDGLSVKAAGERLGLSRWRLYKISKGSGLHERVARILAEWDGEWSTARWMTVAGSHGLGLGREHGQPLIHGQGQGGRISKNRIWYIVKREIEACPHRFRTTWVTILLEGGIPLQVVAEEAGHADLATTRGYIGRRDQASRDRLAEVRFTRPALARSTETARGLTPDVAPRRARRLRPILRVLGNVTDQLDEVLSLPWVPAAMQAGPRDWLLEDGRVLRGWRGLAAYCHEQLAAGVDPGKFGEWSWDQDIEPGQEPVVETLGNLSAFADYMAARQN